MHATVLTLMMVLGGCPGDCAAGHCASCDQLHWTQKLGCGPMPQTCYSPRYGCYPGNSRFIHRYPAFHGAYYRLPYNYRNQFDYPWNAEMHEPTSLYSYNTFDPTLGDIDPIEGFPLHETVPQPLDRHAPQSFVPLEHDPRIKRLRTEPVSTDALGR